MHAIAMQLLLNKLAGSLRSFTVWFNAVVAGLPLLLDYAQSQLPLLREYLPTNVYAWAFSIVVVGNILLRFKTSTALQDK